MDTIDYPTRKDLVASLLDARGRGVLVEVVGNGRTLKFPDGIGAAPEDEVVGELEEPEVEEPTLGICSICEREYLAPVELNHTEEECAVNLASDVEPEVEGEPAEDLIGDSAPKPPKRKRNKS